MEKSSNNGHKELELFSGVLTAETRKQKSSASPNDPSIKPAKIRNSAKHTYDQNQSQSQDKNHTVSQTTKVGLINDNFDSLMEIQKDVPQNQIILNDSQVQPLEIKDYFTESDLKIKKLQKSIDKAQKKNETLMKYVDRKVKMQNEIIEKQNASRQWITLVQEQTNALNNTYKSFKYSQQDLIKLNEDLNLKQIKIKNLTERFQNQVNEKKKLQNKLESESNRLLTIQTKCQELKNKIMEKTQHMHKINRNQEEYKTIIEENKKMYCEKIMEISNAIKDVEKNFKKENEVKNKLITENNENTKKFEELVSKFQALKLTSTEYQKQVESLKINVADLRKKVLNLNNELDRSQHTHIEMISNKDTELAVIREQLQNLTSIHTEAKNKLNEVIADNNKLSDTITKTINDIEQLKNTLQNKNDEITKISTNLSDTLAKNKELSIHIQSLNGKLIAQKSKIYLTEANLNTYKSKKNQYIKTETEIRAEMTMIEQKIKDKSEGLAKLLENINDEQVKYFEKRKKFESDIEEKNKQINELNKVTENLKQEIECKEMEYNSKIEHAISLSKQRESMEYEKQIREQTMKINSLNQQLSAEKLKLKWLNVKTNDTDLREKDKREIQMKELEINYADINEKLLAIEEENKNLESKLREAETLNEIEHTTDLGPTKSQTTTKSSPLIEATYEKDKTMSAVSTPKPILKSTTKDSPFKVQKVQFDFNTVLDIDKINGLEILEEAERRYKRTAELNKPDWAKLQLSRTLKESETSPVVNISQQTYPRKFFKRSEQKEKNCDRLKKSSDPYVFK